MSRVGLFEYLGLPVPNWPEEEATRVSIVDETYDDDPAIGGIGVPRVDATRNSPFSGETYDDSITLPRGEASLFTRTDDETYDDDPGFGALSVPRFSAAITNVGGVTCDDPGIRPG